MTERYEKAERLLSFNTGGLVLNAAAVPRWTGESACFEYVREVRTPEGRSRRLMRVNPRENTCEPACEPAPPAAEPPFPPPEVPSPDGRYVAFTEAHNLCVRDVETGEVIRLTDDGEPFYDYASHPEQTTMCVLCRRLGMEFPPGVLWSPDSKKLLTYRLDQRKVRELHLIQSVSGPDDLRPVLHTYRYPLPGDENVPMAEFVVCDIAKRRPVRLQAEPSVVHLLSPLFCPSPIAEWSEDGAHVYYLDMNRWGNDLRLIRADARSGAAGVVFEEKNDTFIGLLINTRGERKPDIRILEAENELIWQSERDGWAHFYLYDLESGRLKRRITSGPWAVNRLVGVDRDRRLLYFTAQGREAGRDPYYQHLYRVGLDGGEPMLLTPEDAEHDVSLSPDMAYFTDTYSRVDLPPVSVLRSADGALVRELERADIGELLARGYRLPERFTVKAADGVTDLYGLMVRPAALAAGEKCPVIDYCYGGPQRINTPKAFTWTAAGPELQGLAGDLTGGAQSLAQLGFAVVIMDGRGTPFRSKAFQDFSYQNLGGAAGLADHVAGITQLGKRYGFFNMDKIGIWGASGGGYASARALLVYPDFYKVAVSLCGNHDQGLYIAGWAELYHGPYDPKEHREQSNTRLAANLKGKLLLVHGDLDDNVHPANTISLADALIKANKDFDLLLMPNRHHKIALEPYVIRRLWDYFVKNLMGAEPPENYAITSNLKGNL